MLSDSFSVLYRLIPGVVVTDAVVIVIVHVAGVTGVAYLLVSYSFGFGFHALWSIFFFPFCLCSLIMCFSAVVLTTVFVAFFRWCPFPFPYVPC